MEREFIAERQKGLQAYLDVITTHHILSNCELVKKFLDPNNYSVNYTGKWGTALQVCFSMFTVSSSSAGKGLRWLMWGGWDEQPSKLSYCAHDYLW